MASVASFFISRIDTLVDKQIDARARGAAPDESRAAAERCTGKIAIANAKQAYSLFTGLFASPRWRRLAEAGAVPQRLLWASTSAKNPAYRDVVYVEELIGRDTVNTMPPETIDAFRDHGVARDARGGPDRGRAGSSRSSPRSGSRSTRRPTSCSPTAWRSSSSRSASSSARSRRRPRSSPRPTA